MSLQYRLHPPVHSALLATAIVVLFYAPADSSRSLALGLPVSTNTTAAPLLTCMLVHSSPWHLWNNALLLLLFGALFEVVHGVAAHVAVFWIGGFAGVLYEAAMNAEFVGRLLGASGGAYAIVGAFSGHLLINWTETPFAPLFLATLALYVVVLGVEVALREESVAVADWAHGAGLVQGALVGVVVVRNIRVVWWENVLVFVALALSGATLWIGCAQCTRVARA
jgi:membrane associated rhomboid family serine protease